MRAYTVALVALVTLLSVSFFAPEEVLAQIILDGGGDDDSSSRRRRRARAKVECKDGMVDVKGTCCWEGQSARRGKCKGVPKACPAGRTVNAEKETCELGACSDGQVRADDGVHCCWQNQVWSKNASMCKGVPQCPDGTLAMGEDCVADADGDKIVGADDQCPNDPEDMDGFEDANGCPDPDNDLDGVCDPWVADSGKTFPQCTGSDLCANANAPGTTDGCVKIVDGTTPPPVPTGGGEGPSIWSWVAIGSGVALLGTGVALHFVAEGARDEVRDAFSSDGPVSSMTREEALAKEADANSTDTTGAVLMGVGVAAIAGGTALLLLTWPSESSDASASAFVTPDGDWFISLGTRF